MKKQIIFIPRQKLFIDGSLPILIKVFRLICM